MTQILCSSQLTIDFSYNIISVSSSSLMQHHPSEIRELPSGNRKQIRACRGQTDSDGSPSGCSLKIPPNQIRLD